MRADVDTVLPTPLQPDILEQLNISLAGPGEGGVDRQEFLLRFPTSDGIIYAYIAVRWFADPTAPGEYLQVWCISFEWS